MDKHEFNTVYENSLKLIYEHHKDNVDKGNNPYINHLLYVSNNCTNFKSKITGLLHDILEDTDCTEYQLLRNNVSQDIVDAIKLLTKKEDITYNEYINQLIDSNNAIALEVKFWDLTNNMDLSRLDNITEKDLKRVEKRYKPAKEKISKKLKELNIIY